MGASCAGNLGKEALSSKSSPPSPSNLSMHLNADGLMNTSLTERGGLPLLAAWLAVSLWHILHHRGCGCGGCSGDCAHCRTSCGKEDR